MESQKERINEGIEKLSLGMSGGHRNSDVIPSQIDEEDEFSNISEQAAH